MFEIGFMELVVIGALALIVVGPKELPGLLRTVGQYVGKARSMARDFQRTMDEAAREAESAGEERKGALKSLLGSVGAGEGARRREVSLAVHRELAESPAVLQLVQLEDLLGQLEQCNVPGTVKEHPNWRRRYSVAIEDLPSQTELLEVLAAVDAARSGDAAPPPAGE